MVSGNSGEIHSRECKENGTTMVTASPTPYIHTNSNQTKSNDGQTWYAYAWTSTRVGCSTKVTLPGKFGFVNFILIAVLFFKAVQNASTPSGIAQHVGMCRQCFSGVWDFSDDQCCTGCQQDGESI